MKHLWLLIFWIGLSPLQARTPEQQNETLAKVGFTQNLNAQIPLNLVFQDETGASVPLSTYFGKKPVLLNLVYFQCPMLCGEVLNGIIRTLRMIPLSAGKDFNVVTVSIDPREKPTLAAAKKAVYLDKYHRKGAENGWAFLTGSASEIQTLADIVGFHFTYDKEIDQFAHASGIMIVTPTGRLSHYFFGVEYPPQDVRLSLVDASQGTIGSPVERLLLYCYHYDPTTGRYGIAILRVLRVAGTLTFLLLATFVVTMALRERAARQAQRNS